MDEIEHFFDDKKQVVSLRLNSADRSAVRTTAARLFVRESELYRFAVDHLLTRLQKLNDESCTGSDLLPLFMEFKDELHAHLGLKKHQLFKIFNGKSTEPEKFVAMVDIELLLMPLHTVRQRLQMMNDAAVCKHNDTGVWLENYLREKYHLPPLTENTDIAE